MATSLENNYGLPEGFTLDNSPQSSSQGADFGLPEGFTLDQPKPKAPDNRNIVQKGFDKTVRLATQGTIGAIQRATVAYDIPAIVSRKYAMATAPLELRQSIFSDIETLQEKKARGEWGPEYQKEYDTLVELIKDPEKMEQFLPKEEDIPHYDVGGLIESGARKFGVDLTPQGADEMALRWIGFIKNPQKAQDLLKNGLNPTNAKEVIKALAPTGKEALRGVGAASAIQYAAEAEFGPIGTMIAAVLGDMAPSLALKTATGAANVVKHPIQSAKAAKEGIKQGAAKTIVAFTPKDKVTLQKDLIKEFRDAGIQGDAATISGNSAVKWIQATLAQSGLTGEPLQELKSTLTKSITSEYEALANELGESIHQSKYEAGDALKTGLKEARDIDQAVHRELYNSAIERGGSAQVPTINVGSLINELEESLAPGSYKSAEQKSVLDIISQVKKDVMTREGTPKSAKVKELINDKVALNDALNYEVQGGTKKLLERLVGEIDKAIKSHGEVDPTFAKEWSQANAKFAQHAKLFRGKAINDALKTQDPSAIFSKMDTPHGIEEIRKALNVSPQGRDLFSKLARYKLEEVVGKNMVDSTTNQLNFGTFSKLLQKGQNRQIVKSLLGEASLKKLERLQNVSGRLAETGQKFLNSSRSGVHAADLGLAGKIVIDTVNLLSGNPWPLLKSGGGLYAARSASRLLADPRFLQLLEDAILESEKGSKASLIKVGTELAQRVRELELPALAAVQTAPKEK